MSDQQELDVVMFEQPSGNVRGIVTAFLSIKGKSQRIAHATILVGEEPSVSLEVPKGVSLGEIVMFTELLNAFAAKVDALHKS